jgi:hypothetical protein
MGEVLDLHLRVHDERVRQYWRENAKDLKHPSLQIEKLILMGMRMFEWLRRDKPIFRKEDSNLPPLDLYHREHIFGLGVLECSKANILSDLQVRDIYETVKALQIEFQDPRLRNIVNRIELALLTNK